MQNLGDIADLLSVIGTVFSILIWLRMRQEKSFNEQRIKIQLMMPKMLIDLPYEIERKNLTRSEVQGLLGVLPLITDRYKLSYLNTAEFFTHLKAAQDDKDRNVLKIICAEEELQQFDIEKMKMQCEVMEIN